jgi:uncharacterized membrane protein
MPPVSPKQSRRLVESFEAKAMKKRSPSVKFADSLTAFFGTFSFLILNISVFALWIVINLGILPIIPPFDPFPFVLMTTAVSLEAIILSCIVLMSQNRSGVISALREELQLQVNFYSEREITKILKLLDLLLHNQKIIVKDDPELAEMLKDLDHSFIEKKLEEQLNRKPDSPLDFVTKPVEQIGKVVEDNLPFSKK